jgi:hypothetical protein
VEAVPDAVTAVAAQVAPSAVAVKAIGPAPDEE